MESIHSYLDNINVTICSDDPDAWITQNITNINCNDIGFDTESKSIYKIDSDESHILSIIQISTSTDILIYRVFNVPLNEWPISLIKLLENTSINKYCVDSRQDESLLINLGINVKGLIDLQINFNKDKRFGMKTLANELLGLNLNKSKSIQTSDWSKFPLTVKQIEYAASDALICLAKAKQLELAPKKLVRTTPIHVITLYGDKSESIINLLIVCFLHRKKDFKLDSDGFISLIEVTRLIEFKRLYTTIDEVKLTILNDKKTRLILLNDSYKRT